MPIYHAARVDKQLVGGRCQIVAALGVTVGIGYNKLFALFEVHQGMTQFLQCGIVGAQHPALKVDAADALVGFGHLDGL